MLETILKFQGVLGAVVGVIATLIVTHLLRHAGKIYIYFRNWDIKYFKVGEAGGSLETSNLDETEYCSYSFEIEILNSSEVPKVLRDITIVFYDNNKKLIEKTPNDESTKKTFVSGVKIGLLKILNLPPKQLIYRKVSGNIKKEELKELAKHRKVYFEALTYKNKKIKKLVSKKSLN